MLCRRKWPELACCCLHFWACKTMTRYILKFMHAVAEHNSFPVRIRLERWHLRWIIKSYDPKPLRSLRSNMYEVQRWMNVQLDIHQMPWTWTWFMFNSSHIKFIRQSEQWAFEHVHRVWVYGGAHTSFDRNLQRLFEWLNSDLPNKCLSYYIGLFNQRRYRHPANAQCIVRYRHVETHTNTQQQQH